MIPAKKIKKRRKVLIVDHDAFFIEKIKHRFEKGGYACDFAIVGEEVLAKAKLFRPELIFFDFDFPERDAVIGQLRADKSTCEIPVIFLLFDVPKDLEIIAKRLGVAGHVRRVLPMEVLDTATAFFTDLGDA